MSEAHIVSGGSRGLGLVLVERLLADGHRVATFSRSGSAALDELSCRHGKRLQAAQVDGGDPVAIAAFVHEAADRFGGIGHCIANAGHAVPGVLATATDEAIDAVLAVNLRGAIVLVREVIREMLARPRGAAMGAADRSIVLVSSSVATRGSPGLAVYAATKAGLEGFARSLARELGPRRIRVNAVAPGFFASDLSASLGEDDRRRIVRRTSLGRLAMAEDIAGTIEFLTSPQAMFITGQVIAVDGG